MHWVFTLQSLHSVLNSFIFLNFQVDRLVGQHTGMVIRLSTETEEEFSDLKSELDKVEVHDIRSSFYYSWASQSILYKNISVAFEPRLSTAKVVKITAVYGKSRILIIRRRVQKFQT